MTLTGFRKPVGGATSDLLVDMLAGNPRPSVPRAFPAEQWNAIPDDMRGEALSRAAFLLLRGTSPHNALSEALAGMAEDAEAAADVGEFSWPTVEIIMQGWPPPWRSPSGALSDDLLYVAAIAERNARAAFEHQESAPDFETPFGHVAGDYHALEACARAYSAVLNKLRREVGLPDVAYQPSRLLSRS